MDHNIAEPDPALTPSELARNARLHIEAKFNQVRVTGELSNFRRPGSGHWYFSIKDESAQIRCAMFVNRNRFAKLQPKDGLSVVLRGRVSLYEARGDFQIIVDHMEAAGEGALRLAYEALLKQLHSEGLTAAERKRPLPEHPARIAVITSATGAALQDMLSVWRRRYPVCEVVVVDVAVQGERSEPEILRAISRLPELGADLAVITRGGGSLEDMWSFNMESVARALAASPVPTVSAIGHEIDVAITDYVADLRAPTPSAAAELCTPDRATMIAALAQHERAMTRLVAHQITNLKSDVRHLRVRLPSPASRVEQWMQRMDDLAHRSRRALNQRLISSRQQLAGHTQTLQAHHPRNKLNVMDEKINGLAARAERATTERLARERAAVQAHARTLHAVSPLNTLGRGYAILTDEDGAALTSVHALGDTLQAHLADGRADLAVVRVEPGEGLIQHHQEDPD